MVAFGVVEASVDEHLRKVAIDPCGTKMAKSGPGRGLTPPGLSHGRLDPTLSRNVDKDIPQMVQKRGTPQIVENIVPAVLAIGA